MDITTFSGHIKRTLFLFICFSSFQLPGQNYWQYYSYKQYKIIENPSSASSYIYDTSNNIKTDLAPGSYVGYAYFVGNGLVKVRIPDLVMLTNIHGRPITPMSYRIDPIGKDLIGVSGCSGEGGDQWFILNYNGDTMSMGKKPDTYFSPYIDQIKPTTSIPVYSKAKKQVIWGILDSTGRWLIKPKYDQILNFNEKVAWVKSGNFWGSINYKDKFLIKPKYESATDFIGGIAWVKYHHKWGLINRLDSWIALPVFEDIETMHSNKYSEVWVLKDGKWGLMNRAGKFILLPEFDYGVGTNNHYMVKKNGKYGYIDSSRKWLFNPIYNRIEGLRGSYYKVMLDSFYGLCDSIGTTILPMEFKDIIIPNVWNDNNIKIIVGIRDTLRWLYNVKGERLTELAFNKTEQYSEGLLPVRVQQLWGFVDSLGQMVISPQFEDVNSFQKGIAKVKIKGFWGAINTSGKIIEPFIHKSRDFYIRG